MIEFGKTLRDAREAKGYTTSQVADMTHLKTSVVEGLENEDFSMIAAPIYGRGFVKLYCEAVGLEAKPLVEEFMAIVNGDREVAIKERPIADEMPSAVPPPAEEPSPLPEPAASVPPPAAHVLEPDLFRQDPLPPPKPAASVPPAAEPKPESSLSRFAAPARADAAPAGPSFANPRILILAACALALLAVLVLGIRALYRATTSDAAAEPEPAAQSESPAAEAPEPAAKAAPRAQQQNIPSLYID